MVSVAIEYRAAVDDLTANKLLKLRKHELEDEHWMILKDLLRVLKVCTTITDHDRLLTCQAVVQGRNIVLLRRQHPDYRTRHPHDGPL